MPALTKRLAVIWAPAKRGEKPKHDDDAGAVSADMRMLSFPHSLCAGMQGLWPLTGYYELSGSVKQNVGHTCSSPASA